jgi:hypothetical protein
MMNEEGNVMVFRESKKELLCTRPTPGPVVSAIGGFPPNFRFLCLTVNLLGECVKRRQTNFTCIKKYTYILQKNDFHILNGIAWFKPNAAGFLNSSIPLYLFDFCDLRLYFFLVIFTLLV